MNRRFWKLTSKTDLKLQVFQSHIHAACILSHLRHFGRRPYGWSWLRRNFRED